MSLFELGLSQETGDILTDTLIVDAAATAGATAVVVTSTEELDAALAALADGAGGAILLDGTGGPYRIEATGLGSSDTPIVIRALDPNTPPVVEQVRLKDCAGITITGVEVDSSAIADTRADWLPDVHFSDCEDIAFVGNTMVGQSEGFYDGTSDVVLADDAIHIRASHGVVVADNEISNYNHGIFMDDSTGLEITGNDISAIQGDGIRGGGLQNVLIADNYLHDFLGTVHSVNHGDMIQIWGTNAELVNTDIQIIGNVLDAGDGIATQGIHIRNETFVEGSSDPTEGYFQDFVIADNVIHNGMVNGINLNEIEGLEVTNNTVLWNEAAGYVPTVGDARESWMPQIRMGNVLDVTAEENVAGGVQRDGVQLPEENFILDYDDPLSEAYVGAHIVNLSGGGDLEMIDLSFRSDSVLYGTTGAELSSLAGEAAPVVAALSIDGLQGHRLGVTVSADYSFIDGAPVDPDEVTATWVFSDGSTATGMTVAKTFDDPGLYSATLLLETQDGRSETVTRVFELETVENFEISFEDGGTDVSGRDSTVDITDPNGTAFVDLAQMQTAFTGDGGREVGFRLDDDTLLEVTRDNGHLFSLDTFQIDVSFLKEAGSPSGYLLFLQKTLRLDVKADGSLFLELVTDQGTFTVTTEAGVITDTAFHDISVAYDGPAGDLLLAVDGEVVGEADASGTTAAWTGHGLRLGNPWNQNARGIVESFSMEVPPSEVYDDLEDLDDLDGPGGLDGTYVAIEAIADLAATIEDMADAHQGQTLQATDATPVIGTGAPELLLGSAADDTLSGEGGRDIALGGGGSDAISGGDKGDALSGGVGGDMISGGQGWDQISGGGGDDTLLGGAGHDILIGDAGNDALYGGGLRDVLMGGEGDDDLFGGAREDVLIAGPGSDTLTGGGGGDYFVFDTALDAEIAVITDFDVAMDSIVLGVLADLDPDLGFATFLAGAEQVGADIVFTAGNGAQLTLQDVALTALTAANFAALDTAVQDLL